jgi:hypothetical protein
VARLYSRMHAGAIDDPEYGHFEPDPDHGGFDLPDELSDRLHSFHHRGKPGWESEIEQDERLHGEESARRRDPETLYNAVAGIAGIAAQLAALQAGGVPDAAKGEVAKLTAEVEALRAQLAEATTGSGEVADSGGDGAVRSAKDERSAKGGGGTDPETAEKPRTRR